MAVPPGESAAPDSEMSGMQVMLTSKTTNKIKYFIFISVFLTPSIS
jgi:hypothetical protein